MNEPGGPAMPPANLPTANPPSYLRPPVSRPASSSPNSFLFLVAGVIAIAACAGLWFALSPKNASIQGAVYFETQSGFARYQFSAKTFEDFPLKHASGTYTSHAAAFSPSGRYFVESVTDSSSNKPMLFVTDERTSSTTLVAVGNAGVAFDSPIASSNGKQIAYSFFSQAKSAPGSTATSTISTPTLVLATLVKNTYHLQYVQDIGTPIAFSPDGTELLSLERNASVLVTSLSSSGSYPLVGLPAGTISNIAAAPDQHAFAVTVNGTLYLGTIDWGKRLFAIMATLPNASGSAHLADPNNLLLITNAGADFYQIEGSKISRTAQVSWAPPSGATPLLWRWGTF